MGFGGAGKVENGGDVADAQQGLQQFGLAAVALHDDVEAAPGEAINERHEIFFLPVGAAGGVQAGDLAVQQIAARDAGFHDVAGEKIGDDFAAALLDGFAVEEEGEFHAFGIAVDGLAVGAVEGVEFLGVFLEVNGAVLDVAFSKEGLDDFAADAVGSGVESNAHEIISGRRLPGRQAAATSVALVTFFALKAGKRPPAADAGRGGRGRRAGDTVSGARRQKSTISGRGARRSCSTTEWQPAPRRMPPGPCARPEPAPCP